MIDLPTIAAYLPALTDLATVCACGVLAWIAFTDLTDARIDNRANVLLFCAGVIATYAAPDPTWHVAAAVVTFASTFFLWQTDNLGGGDVKMLTMIALCLGAAFPWFLVAFGFCAVCVAFARGWMPRRWRRTKMVPMGVVAFPAFALTMSLLQGGV